jgi:subtilisin family serine protease
MTRPLPLFLLVALLLLIAGQAFAQASKLDARARIALAQLQAGEPLSEMLARAEAVSREGDLDVFVVGSVSRAVLESAGARVRSQAGEVFTAYIPVGAINAVAALPGVRQISGAALCEQELDSSVPATNASALRGAGPDFIGLNGAGVLVGDVDSGIDYNHGDFLDPLGNSRLLWLWDQTDAGGPNPSGYAYGSEWTQADLTANLAREVDTGAHGTHVMGIAGGDGSATGGAVPAFTYTGMAPKADLFFVKTTMYTTDILDGVTYLFQKATALGRNAAVNLSLGSHYGPHDGTSPFEAGLSALTGPGRVVIKSAGNERASNRHAGLFATGAGDSCKLSITAGGTTSGRFLAIDSYYNAPDNINVTIRTPGNLFIGPITLGNVNVAYPGQTTGVNGRVYIENGLALTSNGDRQVYFEITSLGTGTGSINGTWTFYFTPVALGGSGRVDLWRYYTSSTSLTPCTFTLRNTDDHLISEPGNAVELITAASWTSKKYWTDCGGRTLVSWTGTVSPGNLSPFSSPGPTRDNRLKPDIAAPGSAIGSALTRDGTVTCPSSASTLLPDGMMHVMNQGTSMAAPHVTGAAALVMQKYGAVTPAFIKSFLNARAVVDGYTGTAWNKDWGNGKMWLGDMLDPAVTVTSPNGGETLLNGTLADLTWTATDAGGVTTVDLLMSWTGAAGPYVSLVSGIANSGSYPWTVTIPGGPSCLFSDCWLKVVAHDAQGNAGEDISDAEFTLMDLATPTVLSRFTASPVAAGIELRWQFSDPGSLGAVTVERAGQADGPWTGVAVEQRDENGVNVALDRSAQSGSTYWYRIAATAGATRLTFGPIEATAGEVIVDFALSRPVPSPTSGAARVDFAVPRDSRVSLGLYDMQGRRVATLVEGLFPAGRHQAMWNGTAGGRSVRAGIYFLRMQAPGVNLTRRLVVTR